MYFYREIRKGSFGDVCHNLVGFYLDWLMYFLIAAQHMKSILMPYCIVVSDQLAHLHSLIREFLPTYKIHI